MSRPFGSVNTHPRSDRRSNLRRLVDHPPPTPLDTPCRLWQGSLQRQGYGRHWVPGRGMVLVHRWVMEQVYGREAIADLYVLHRCDNPLCYRFDHLFLGTAADNSRDMVNKGRGRTQLRADDDGHPTRKLSVADHAEIRERYTGAWGEQTEMARKYDVNRSTIVQILGRRGRGGRDRLDRWARSHDHCIDCGSDEHRHRGLGRCVPCYGRARRA